MVQVQEISCDGELPRRQPSRHLRHQPSCRKEDSLRVLDSRRKLDLYVKYRGRFEPVVKLGRFACHPVQLVKQVLTTPTLQPCARQFSKLFNRLTPNPG
jgi:hypothetical protein